MLIVLRLGEMISWKEVGKTGKNLKVYGTQLKGSHLPPRNNKKFDLGVVWISLKNGKVKKVKKKMLKKTKKSKLGKKQNKNISRDRINEKMYQI